jgi:hypothetical protein
MTSLARFYAAMLPFLERQTSVAETVAVLGESPSGNKRFSFYPEAIRRQRRRVLDAFYKDARVACNAASKGLWKELAEAFMRTCAPTSWDPNRYAEPMLVYLREQAKHDARIPAAALEIADYAWTRFQAMAADHPQDGRIALGTALFVRRYNFDITSYAKRVEKDETTAGAPEPMANTLLLYRSRITHRFEVATPSKEALVVLRRRESGAEACALPTGMSEDAVTREEASLIALGILGNLARAEK